MHWPGQSGWKDAMLQKKKKTLYQDLKEENKNCISLLAHMMCCEEWLRNV